MKKLLLLLPFILYSCVQPNEPDGASGGNNKPVVQSILVDPVYITVGTTADISVTASDPDNDRIDFEWSCSLGDIIGSGSKVKYTAAYCCLGEIRIYVTVKDSKGAGTTEYVDLVVNP